MCSLLNELNKWEQSGKVTLTFTNLLINKVWIPSEINSTFNSAKNYLKCCKLWDETQACKFIKKFKINFPCLLITPIMINDKFWIISKRHFRCKLLYLLKSFSQWGCRKSLGIWGVKLPATWASCHFHARFSGTAQWCNQRLHDSSINVFVAFTQFQIAVHVT